MSHHTLKRVRPKTISTSLCPLPCLDYSFSSDNQAICGVLMGFFVGTFTFYGIGWPLSILLSRWANISVDSNGIRPWMVNSLATCYWPCGGCCGWRTGGQPYLPSPADNVATVADMGPSAPTTGLLNGAPAAISIPPHSPGGGSMMRSRAGHGSQAAAVQHLEQINVGIMLASERS